MTDRGPHTTPPSSLTEARHPATAKAWEWFENEAPALGYTPTLLASIEAKLKEIDALFLDWERETDRG